MQHLHHGALGSISSLMLTVLFVVLGIVYLRGWFVLRSNGIIRPWRAFSFFIGLLLIWIALASPIAIFDHELLTAHMLQHVLLMTLAPPLIWLGEPLRSCGHGIPESLLHLIVLDRLQLHRLGRFLAKPEVGWLAASAALVVWHIPRVFAAGMNSEVLHMFEQWSFLGAGLLFWWPVIEPWPAVSTPELSMILYLFFATRPCDILSGFLVFCDRVVYPSYLSSSHLLGFSALGDQQCAAALMWTSVTVVYLIAGVVLTMHLLSPRSYSEHDGLDRGPGLSALQKVEALRGD